MINEFRGSYYFLSNFYKSPFEYNGDTYLTAEHAFQCAKTTNPAEKEKIKNYTNPLAVKMAGKKVSLRPDWENALLRTKFQNKTLNFLRSGWPLQNILIFYRELHIIQMS